MSSIKQVPSEKQTTEDPDLAERFNRILSETVEGLEDAGIRYVFIGGIASGGLGRPRSTHDIDIFVVPEEAELTLRALTRKGFRTEKTDPSWLYKAFKEDILVDVIFKSKGEIYLDTEMYQRITVAEFHGKRLRLVSPEDLVIIKAAAHSELTPSHWHDAIALLSYANIDWQYLLKRARRAPRRILSLLLYAQSNDIWVPNSVIHELYNGIFENTIQTPSIKYQETIGTRGPSDLKPRTSDRVAEKGMSSVSYLSPQQRTLDKSIEKQAKARGHLYAIAHLRERFVEDSRTNELDIQVEQLGNTILLKGEVALRDRKDAVEKIALEVFPGMTIDNQIRVSNFHGPAQVEDVK